MPDNYLMPKAITSHIEDIGLDRRLRRAINEGGLVKVPQYKLAERWGIAPSMVSGMLGGIKLPALDSAIRIARDLDIHVEWLLTGRGPIRINENESIFDGLTEAQIRHIKSTIHIFKESNLKEQ